MSFNKVSVLGAALIAFAFGEVSIAYAQGIEEIVVTARKREESLQSVPVAVTAFSGDYLTQSGVEQFSDLGRETPNLSISQQSTYGNATADGLSLRGQTGGGTQISGDPSVSVLNDGVLNPHVTGLQAGFFDLERIEVLKGPQGTLFGRNTTGGAINIIAKKADYDGMHGFIEGEGGNHSKYAFRGAVNVPLIEDMAAVRLAYQLNKRDGFGKSAITGQDLGSDQDENYFRGSLRLDPFEDLSIMVVGDWLRERENGPLVVTRDGFPNGLTNLDASLVPASGCAPFDGTCGLAFEKLRGVQGGQDIFTNYSDIDNFDDTDAWSFGVTIEWDVSDDVTIKSITGRRSMEHNHLTNFSGSDFKAIVTGDPLFPDRDLHQEYDLFTQEFNVSGIALDGKLDWLGGVFYSDDEGSDRDWVSIAQNLMPMPGGGFFFHFDAPVVDQKSWAVFGQTTYSLTDTLDLTMGGRWTEETKEQVNAHGTVLAVGPPTFWSCGNANFGGPVFTFDRLADCALPLRSVTYGGYSWLFSLDWQATEDMLLYAKHARGFRGGGFDIRSAGWPGIGTPPPDPFSPETAFDVEIGAKADWLDGMVRTNVAAFRTKYANKQESVIIPGPATVTNNAGEATLYGVEGELYTNPFEGLTLNATVAWLRGEYDDFKGAPVENAAFNPIALAPGFDAATNNGKGELFADPRWTYSVSGRYEAPVSNGVVGISANWSWVDEINTSTRRTDFQLPKALRDEFDDSVGLLNARIDYNVEEWGVTFALWSTNLLNNEYQRSGVTQANMVGVQTGITNEPRMYGGTVTYRFGGE